MIQSVIFVLLHVSFLAIFWTSDLVYFLYIDWLGFLSFAVQFPNLGAYKVYKEHSSIYHLSPIHSSYQPTLCSRNKFFIFLLRFLLQFHQAYTIFVQSSCLIPKDCTGRYNFRTETKVRELINLRQEYPPKINWCWHASIFEISMKIETEQSQWVAAYELNSNCRGSCCFCGRRALSGAGSSKTKIASCCFCRNQACCSIDFSHISNLDIFLPRDNWKNHVRCA